MKPFTAIFFAACLVSLRALVAQEPDAVPIPAATPQQGEAPATSQPTPPPLFPSETPPPIVNKPPRGGEEHPPVSVNPLARTNRPAETVEDVAANVAYRKAKTKALRDEKIQQALADVAAAKTYPGKYAALKNYYTLLADRILKIDGSLKKLVAERLKTSLKELDQSRVRPADYPQQASAEH